MTTAHAYLATPTSVPGTSIVDSTFLTPTSVPGTPTSTLTELQKVQLIQQIDQQQHTFQNWLWNLFTSSLATLAVLAGGLFAFFRWLGDRQDARKKQAEERFKSVVEGLGSESRETRITSAVLLRTFLDPDYKKFYTQVFDLAVANLRSHEYKETISRIISSVKIPESPDSFSQSLVTLFKGAFPRAREEVKEQLRKQRAQFDPQILDATGIQLNEAFLFGADLRQAWMRGASLNKANLIAASLNPIQLEDAILTEAQLGGANLSGAYLSKANLSQAVLENTFLKEANLSEAKLSRAVLKDAIVIGANLGQAVLENADLTGANLSKANLTGANLTEALLLSTDFSEADLSGAILENADLTGANLSKANLTGANLSKANLTGAILENTILNEAKVTVEQLVTAISLEGTNMPNGLIDQG